MQPLGSAGAPMIARGTVPRYTTFDTRLNARFERAATNTGRRGRECRACAPIHFA